MALTGGWQTSSPLYTRRTTCFSRSMPSRVRWVSHHQGLQGGSSESDDDEDEDEEGSDDSSDEEAAPAPVSSKKAPAPAGKKRAAEPVTPTASAKKAKPAAATPKSAPTSVSREADGARLARAPARANHDDQESPMPWPPTCAAALSVSEACVASFASHAAQGRARMGNDR